jgi:hypothetical protein
MRCGTGTKSGEPSRVTAVTKLTITCFVAPSFHDGSASAAVCAGADVEKSVPDNTGSAAKVETRARRLMPHEATFEFIFSS